MRSEDLSGEIQSESGESQPAEPTDDAEARADFWSIQGDFIYRHHNEPRVQLTLRAEGRNIPYSNKNTWILQGLLMLIWMCHKKNVLMIVGMSIQTETCQIHGKVSRSLP